MKNFQEDFEEFCASHEAPLPALHERILRLVRADLEPSQSRVFLKLLALHTLASLGTLSLCSQFGFRLFEEGPDLMELFMRFGGVACMSACGAIFLGLSLFLAPFVLSRFELKTLERMKLVHFALLGGFSLAFFASMDVYLSLNLILAWSLGALLGAYVLYGAGRYLKAGLLKRAET